MNGALVLSRGLSPACCKVLIALIMAGSALDVAALELWTGLERKALGHPAFGRIFLCSCAAGMRSAA